MILVKRLPASFGQGKYHRMARDVMAARSATMIEIRCGRCDPHGRPSIKRLFAL